MLVIAIVSNQNVSAALSIILHFLLSAAYWTYVIMLVRKQG